MKKAVPFIAFGLLVLFVVLIQIYAPKSINWNQTFEKRDKNPYGDFILHDFLKDIFPDKKITVKDRTLYETLDYYDYSSNTTTTEDIVTDDESNVETIEETEVPEDENNEDASLAIDSSVSAISMDTTPAELVEEKEFKNSKIIHDVNNQFDYSSVVGLRNYVIINTSFSPGSTDANAILDFVQKGNCAFISAENITGTFADSLNLETNIGYYERDFSKEDLKSGPKTDSIYLTLLNKNLTTFNKKYWYRDGTVTGYFAKFDTANTIILGKNSNDQPNFIRVQYGQGVFLISSTPLAYTNYNMLLANNAEYISSSFSYLPVRDTYWDEYYKNFRKDDHNEMRFMESQPPLLWAYYVALFSAIAYVLFEMKRRQRIIPVVEPPKNTTVEFVSTIGRLYFQSGNHKDIANKKIHYFLEYIRSTFYLNTNVFDKEFIDKITERSGVDKTKITQLFALIQHLQKAYSVGQRDLMELNKKIEEFKGGV